MKNQKGITLIALVITIVVLIILAGVTMNLTLGEDGIFTKAQYAKEKYEMVAAKESIELAIAEIQTEKRGTNETLTIDTIITELSNKLEGITITKDGNIIKGVYQEYPFTINEKFELTLNSKDYEQLEIIEYDDLTMVAGNTISSKLIYTGKVQSKKFESSNENVVTVEENGNITAIAEGIATVTVTLTAQDGTILSENCIVTVENSMVKIGRIHYKSLQNAVDAVPRDNTLTIITLLSNIEESDINTEENTNIKLDLNEKTIIGKILNGGNLDITNGIIDNSTEQAIYNSGTISLANVTISSDNDSLATITNLGILNIKENTIITAEVSNAINNSNTVNIYEGSIYCSENTLVGSNGTYNIYGGTIYSTAKAAIAAGKNTSINIYGGTMYAKVNALNVPNTVTAVIEGGVLYSKDDGHAVWVASGGNVTIKGGTLQCENVVSQEALDIDSGGTATIQGGTIEHLNGGKAILCDGTMEINGSTVLIQNSSSGTSYPTVKIGTGATCTFTRGTIKNNTSGGCCYYDNNDTTTQKTDIWTK